jgi:hypothetical protein
MPTIDDLILRIDLEVAAAKERVDKQLLDEERAYEERKLRIQKFLSILDGLDGIGVPRLKKLAEHFKFQTTPVKDADGRGTSISFQTDIASVRLKFYATHDADVRNLVLNYDLEILPIYIKFNPHAQLEMPLDAVDVDQVAAWIDDRIIEFVRTYLTIHMNDQYQKGHMAIDPAANVRFPIEFARATFEHNGQKYYFISEKTRDDFAIAVK